MKFYVFEPTGRKSYLLFDTMEATFHAQGHSFVNDPADADVVFFDLWNKHGGYTRRNFDKITFWSKPVVGFDMGDYWGSAEHRPNWWGWDGMLKLHSSAEQNEGWAVCLLEFINKGLLKLMFTRKMGKSWDYPFWVKPLEVALYHDHDFPMATKEEYLARSNDVCFIGNATPWRANAAVSLSQNDIHADFYFPFHRLDHETWLNRHRQAKMFMEADGGGFGSERPYQVGTIAPMLKIRNDQLQPFPWTDGVNCLEVGDQWGYVSAGECEQLKAKLQDNDFMWGLYINGVAHLKEHYSNEARASYILTTVEEALK